MSEAPIPLRLHHLNNIQQIMLNGSDAYQNNTRQILSSNRTHGDKETQSYYADLVGPIENEESWITMDLAVQQFYINLDLNQPINLIPNGKDLSCNTCFIGKHCLNEGLYSAEVTIADDLELTKISKGIVGNFDKIGNKKDRTFHVLTTMAVIKAILSINHKLFIR